LTNTERLFIRKAYENKVVSETTLIRDAVYNAMHNAYRKKGASFMELWKERKPVDKKEVQADMTLVAKIEKKEAGWIDMIYRNAGLRKPKKKKKK
jgi:alanine-alpha-ketoisovalerate/valine-pyruvate aminotransferase